MCNGKCGCQSIKKVPTPDVLKPSEEETKE
jgi:hypothetical protein